MLDHDFARKTNAAATKKVGSVGERDEMGFRFCAAVRGGEMGTISSLLSLGMDPDMSFQGAPLIELAARWNSPGALEILVGAGAKVDRMCSGSMTALAKAAAAGALECVEIFIKAGVELGRRGSGPTPLFAAARLCKPEVMCALLAAGAKVDEVDALGRSALMEAVICGQVDCAQLALAHGADPNWADAEKGMTPPMMASRFESGLMLSIFFERGFDPFLKNFAGESVSSMLASLRSPAAVGFRAWMLSRQEMSALSSSVFPAGSEGVGDQAQRPAQRL